MARIAIAGLSYTESFTMRIVQRISILLIVYVCIGSGYAQTDNDCERERFRCRNGECIAGELLCDGTADCKDSSDETESECKKILCPDYAFRCNYGGCINRNYVCNGIQDCVDNSDETQPQCRTTTGRKNQRKRSIQCVTGFHFTCNNGECISRYSMCNGIRECADGSDETSALCGSLFCDGFRCDYGGCLYGRHKLCNGEHDCADGSDESHRLCAKIESSSLLPVQSETTQSPHGVLTQYSPSLSSIKPHGVLTLYSPTQSPVPPHEVPNQSPRRLSSIRPHGTLSPYSPTQSPVSPHEVPTQYSTTRPTVTPSTKNCIAPPQPQNGRWKLHRLQCPDRQECNVPVETELGLGSHLIYSCNPGYKIRGPTDVSCSIEGNWLNIPVCTEIRCKALSTASVEARCTYGVDDEWVSCESPVLPRTKAALACRNSYRRETSLLSSQRNNVRCNANGQWEPEPIRCIPVCGALPVEQTPFIINGNRPNITEFPWHASMYREIPGESKKYFCGASIIQENLLITAAHCVYDENTGRVVDANKMYIVTGNIFRDYDSPLHNPRLVKKNQVKNIYIHCNYLGLIGNYMWDIAILELVEPFVLSASLVPICIDTFSDRAVLEKGTYGKVAGFGRTAVGDSSAVLQAVTVPYIPFSQCKSASKNASTEQFITIDKFCAGYTNGSSVCDGDSGGGLAFKTNSLWYLRGIVSVSLGTILDDGTPRCDNNLYSLYTQISIHIEWIQHVIAKIEQNLTHSLCSDRF